MITSPPVRVAVVGLGYWGPNLVRNLQEAPAAEIVAVCDKQPDALERIARRYPSVRTTTESDDGLGASDIEAVAIPTPVATHEPLAAAALRAGKHVFVEKPLAASLEQGLRLARPAPQRGPRPIPRA